MPRELGRGLSSRRQTLLHGHGVRAVTLHTWRSSFWTRARGRPALTAVDLTADRTMITAVANDVGIPTVFVRHVIAEARQGDGLIGLSTSGNSANLVKAFLKAKEMGVTTVGLPE